MEYLIKTIKKNLNNLSKYINGSGNHISGAHNSTKDYGKNGDTDNSSIIFL